MRICARVDLPVPFGPIKAWISPDLTVRLTPLSISLPSTVACKFFISRTEDIKIPPRVRFIPRMPLLASCLFLFAKTTVGIIARTLVYVNIYHIYDIY